MQRYAGLRPWILAAFVASVLWPFHCSQHGLIRFIVAGALSQYFEKLRVNSQDLDKAMTEGVIAEWIAGMARTLLFAASEKSDLQVNVRFYGFFRDVVSGSKVELEMPAQSTLRELFNRLVKNFGEQLRERLFTSSGDLETNVKVFLGDTQAMTLEESLGNGQRSSAEVKVFVLSATAGG